MKTRGALLLVLLALLVVHFPALVQGKILGAEDVLALHWADKYRLHNLWTGKEHWSAWDPLPFLGMPRLANAQQGWFCPDNLYFLLLEPLPAWRFYAVLSDLGLLLAGYYFLKPMVSKPCAWLGAGLYVCCGDCLRASQNPPVKSAIIAMMLILAFNQRWLASGKKRYLVGLAGASAWQIVVCAVSQLYYQFLSLPFMVLLQIVQTSGEQRWRRGLVATLVFLGSTLACSIPWFPLLEWSSHGSRDLIGGTSFAEAYRLTAQEALMVFCDESLAIWPKAWEHGGGYPLMPGFSVAVLIVILYACRRRRARWVALLALVLGLQMLGERGIFLWLLHKLVPLTQQIRGPQRFMFCASLLWVQAAALGLDELLKKRPKLAWALGVWALSANAWMMQTWFANVYVDKEEFAGIPMLPAGSGRMVVNYSHEPRPPLFWLPYPLTQGRPTLMIPHSAVDGSFFRGMLYSQYGRQATSLIPKLVFYSTPLPPLKPDHPLMRSWGLQWILQSGEAGFRWQYLGPTLRHWTVVQVQACPDANAEDDWAAATDWKPFEQAALAGAVPSLGKTPAKILSIQDTPDEQILETEGETSLLVSGDNWDPGWECTIDQQPVEVRRANLALKACLVPAGRHQIRWRYRYHWPAKAAPVVLVGLALLMAAAVLAKATNPTAPGDGAEAAAASESSSS